MQYINLNRLLTAGAAALLLSLPLTACSKDDPQSGAEVQITDTTASESDSTLCTESEQSSEKLTRSSKAAVYSGTVPVSSAETLEASAAGTDRHDPETTGTQQNRPDSDVPTVSGDALTASAGEKHVAVPVTVHSNPGFAVIGISLQYDEGLTGLTAQVPAADYTLGEVGSGMMAQCYINPAKHMVGFAGLSSVDLTADGVLFTCYFDVPADAKSGQTYLFRPEITYANNVKTGKVSFETADFTLTIK